VLFRGGRREAVPDEAWWWLGGEGEGDIDMWLSDIVARRREMWDLARRGSVWLRLSPKEDYAYLCVAAISVGGWALSSESTMSGDWMALRYGEMW